MNLRKFSKQHNLKFITNLAYGYWGGYAVTMIDRNNGVFTVEISTSFSVPGTKESLERYLQGIDLKGQYKITDTSVQSDRITVNFRAMTAAVLNQVEAFLTWFTPVLGQYSAAYYNRCPVCGQEIQPGQGQWVMEEDIVRYLHPGCTQKLMDTAASDAAMNVQNHDGSYINGFVGAIIAAALGAVVWGFVLKMGYFVGWLGLLIGLAVCKGYELMHGKVGKGKGVILVVSVVLSVVAGTFLAYIFNGLSLQDILLYLEASGEARTEFFGNMGLGLLFSAFGLVYVISKSKKDFHGKTIRVLK